MCIRDSYESWSPLWGHLPTVQHENVPRVRKQTLVIFFAAKEKATLAAHFFGVVGDITVEKKIIQTTNALAGRVEHPGVPYLFD